MSPPSSIQTVRGPVAPSALGHSLTHEHVLCSSPRSSSVFGCRGVEDAELDAMTIGNPSRVLAW
jgi:predicted metal-dependent phosphotriesterase family hydrolase